MGGCQACRTVGPRKATPWECAGFWRSANDRGGGHRFVLGGPYPGSGPRVRGQVGWRWVKGGGNRACADFAGWIPDLLVSSESSYSSHSPTRTWERWPRRLDGGPQLVSVPLPQPRLTSGARGRTLEGPGSPGIRRHTRPEGLPAGPPWTSKLGLTFVTGPSPVQRCIPEIPSPGRRPLPAPGPASLPAGSPSWETDHGRVHVTRRGDRTSRRSRRPIEGCRARGTSPAGSQAWRYGYDHLVKCTFYGLRLRARPDARGCSCGSSWPWRGRRRAMLPRVGPAAGVHRHLRSGLLGPGAAPITGGSAGGLPRIPRCARARTGPPRPGSARSAPARDAPRSWPTG